MKFRSLVASLATVMTSAVVACSSGTSASPSDSSDFVAELCELYTPCCARANLATDGLACRKLYSRIGAGSDYDPGAGNDCLSETRARSNEPDFCAQPIDFALPCSRVYRARQSPEGSPIGAACASDNECAPSADGDVHCWPSESGGISPVCQLRLEGHAGDAPCLATVDASGMMSTSSGIIGTVPIPSPSRGYLCNVVDGIYCASTGACTKIEGIGGACDVSSWSCSDSYCDPDTKTCTALVDEGSSCVSSDFACAKNLFCDLATRTCTAKRALGAPCTLGSQCESAQCVNGACGSVTVSTTLCGH